MTACLKPSCTAPATHQHAGEPFCRFHAALYEAATGRVPEPINGALRSRTGHVWSPAPGAYS